MQISKTKNRLHRFKKWVFGMLLSLFLAFAFLQVIPSYYSMPFARAIKCDDVVEDGKTAKQLGLPCNDEGLSVPNKELIDDSISTEEDATVQVLKIVNYFISFLGLLAVVGIVYSGFLMVTAMGNEDQFEKGKKGIGYIAIGIIVILLSYTIVNWIIKAGD